MRKVLAAMFGLVLVLSSLSSKAQIKKGETMLGGMISITHERSAMT